MARAHSAHAPPLRAAGALAVLLLMAGLAAGADYPSYSPTRPTRSRLIARRRGAPGLSQEGSPPEGVDRLVPRPLISASRGARPLRQAANLASELPAGEPIPGEYIVVYKSNVRDTRAAAAESQARAAAAVSDSVAAGAITAAATPAVVVSTSPSPDGVPSHAVIQVPTELSVEHVRRVLSSPEVEAVVPNRVVSIAQAAGQCYKPLYAAGVQGKPAAGVNFAWNGCLVEGTALALFGERCTANRDKFRWMGIYAYNTTNGQMYRNCVRLRSAETDSGRLEQFFGDCGVAPTLFARLPTNVCLEDEDTPCVPAGQVDRYNVQLSRAVCQGGSTDAQFQGVTCGPGDSLVQWNVFSPRNCGPISRGSADARQQTDWVGQCGVPPQQISGLPTRVCGRTPSDGGGGGPNPPPPDGGDSPAPPPPDNPPPPPSGGTLGRLPLAALRGGENPNWGMSRVGAYVPGDRDVIDISDAVAASGFKVAVIDTGVQRDHPDLNVVEFNDYVDSAGSGYYGRDGNGHGTHVGGIIGAKNNGNGVTGVAPGMPIIAYKVLPASGSGPLDTIYQAYQDVLARLRRGDKIAAINLSLSSASAGDAESQRVECSYVSQIQAYGTAVVVAAGNDGRALDYNLPAACGDAMTVTSLDSGDGPSSFSNYATSGNKRGTLIAAPGGQIYSTYTGGGYQTLSGTSMATPFVTGAFATCFLSGACKLQQAATTGNYPVMQGAAQAQACGGSGRCGPSWGSAYQYGYMVNVRRFYTSA